MITVQEAEKIIRRNLPLFPSALLPLDKACGNVLREDIFADRDQPASHKVLMDGIAIRYSSWEKGARRFKIEATQAAGQKTVSLNDPKGCIEVMTGAVLPEGTGCVIPVEHVTLEGNQAVIPEGIKLTCLQNILPRASDYKKGERLLKAGIRLFSCQIAVLAAVGKAKVRISYKPQIAIIATGNELVDIHVAPKSYEVRLSNSYALRAALEGNGFDEPAMFHIPDDQIQLKRRIRRILDQFDVLIFSGGVSMGKFDFVSEVLTQLGVEVLFHRVRQKPGKPFWFGISRRGKAVFALPGNPASTQVCFYRYVLPQLQRSMGMRPEKTEWAMLSEDFQNKTSLTYFLPVKLKRQTDAHLLAQPVSVSGSGDYLALARSEGFVELEAEQRHFKRKAIVPFYRW